MLTSATIDVGGGVDLEIVEAGAGTTTLVVAPGFGGGIDSYVAFIEQLAHEYHVVGVSPRGFGRSGWAPPYAIGDWVDDLLGVVRHRTERPVVAVGHSFGATLALAAAAGEPSRFRGVISLDGNVEVSVFLSFSRQLIGYWQQVRLAVIAAAGDPDMLAARLSEVIVADSRLGDTTSADELHRVATIWSGQDPDVVESVTDERFDEWANDPALDDLPRRVQCPVFCVNGDPDAGSIVSTAQGVRDLAVYPGSAQVRLDGTDHRLGLDETPARVVDAMRSFLTGLK